MGCRGHICLDGKQELTRLSVCFLLAWIGLFSGSSPDALAAREAFAIDATATPFPGKSLQSKLLLQIAPITVHDYPAPVAWVGWSPDAKRLAVVYEDDHEIRIVDPATGKADYNIDVPEATTRGGFDLAWSPDGKRLAGTFDIAYGPDGIIKIWSLDKNSAQLTTIINRPSDRSAGIAWSPDGARLSSVHFSDTRKANVLSIWDARTGALLTTKERVTGGLWSPDSKQLLVLSQTLQLVNAETFQVIAEFPPITTGEVLSGYMAWSADGTTVVGTMCKPSRADLCHLWAWNPHTGELFLNFDQSQADSRGYVGASPLALSRSGILLAKVETQSNLVELWDMRTGDEFALATSAVDVVTAFGWHPYQDQIVLGSTGGFVQIWELYLSSTVF